MVSGPGEEHAGAGTVHESAAVAVCSMPKRPTAKRIVGAEGILRFDNECSRSKIRKDMEKEVEFLVVLTHGSELICVQYSSQLRLER